ncbi:unnamed protein product [Orchesella dallaii]|uniref:Cyclin N-terminal domain-containing protein n=1 Tax=Orchesella dallaii TaxID=48710 RepID=A0ABP1Q471_9HEXA
MFGLPYENVSHDSNFWPGHGQNYYFVPGDSQQQYLQLGFQMSTVNSQFYREPSMPPPPVTVAGFSGNGSGSRHDSFDFFMQAQQHEQLQSCGIQLSQHHEPASTFQQNNFPFNFTISSEPEQDRMRIGNSDKNDKNYGAALDPNPQPIPQGSCQPPEDLSFLSQSRLEWRLSQTVARFQSEEKSKTPYDGKTDKSGGLSLCDVPDPESYVVFDKLWSSEDQQTILSEQWNNLVVKISKQQPRLAFKLSATHVRGIFYICRTFKTNFTIRFRALELYSRYMRMFIDEMSDYFKTLDSSTFDEFMARFESQILLRMSTCILIASKLHADTQLKSLTVEKVRKFLKKQGLTYNCETISRSELRVLTTLEFRCHWVTPLELIEQLLSLLDLTITALQRAHYFCILLLEYCYVDLENIRLKFSASIKYELS